jgi:glycosyltransferase involved in cell wall biosynthesis
VNIAMYPSRMAPPSSREGGSPNRSNVRILLVGKGPPARDGIATFLQGLLEGLGDRFDVRLLNLTRSDPPAGGKLTSANLRRTLRDLRDLWRESGSADVVHIHSALAPLVTMARAGALAAAGRSRGCRVVVHAHGGLVSLWLTTRPRRLLARVALAPTSRVIAVSEGGRSSLARVLGAQRVELIDNWVDPERFGPPQVHDGPPRILYAGFITPRKGLLDLIQASAHLVRRGVEHELLLAGGTPAEGPDAEREVRTAAGPHVRFLGSQPHEAMPDLYRMSDVFCLPSWWEAMPLSVMEAMASGLPVVATSVGDIPRLIVDGVNGHLVPPRDPMRLTGALESLLLDPDLRARMGTAGRRRMEESFAPKAALAAIATIYRDLGSK